MPTPIASFGNNSALGGEINEKLLPEYEIVHASVDLASALKELPALAGGDLSVTPSSGFGTNAGSSSPQAPKAIIIGGTVPADETAQLTAAVAAAAPGVKIITISREDIVAAGGSGPDPGVIVSVFKKKLADEGI
ncbi:hypothetical protein B0T14DRAFT_436628 [Immersiella caudata]|uniref:Uncharacterized protein n=1 Tax=Immersiella caudata TaxID=314043 RepID=A0AA39WFY3_9PEZI|nr:hypothetical protein B0T14DRAFT_436628 [Immersiella caudata]